MHIFTFQNNLGRLIKYAWIENAKVGDQHQIMFAYFSLPNLCTRLLVFMKTTKYENSF